MDPEKIKGYADQELLFRAILKFLSAQINRSEQITAGLMKQSLNDWAVKNGITIREVKHRTEEERMKMMAGMIDVFVDRIKHLIDSKTQRERLKNNIMQIYTQWKITHRQEDVGDVVAELNNIME